MTAAPESPETRPDCEAVADEFTRRLRGLETETLRIILQVIQARLGTAKEDACDIERAQCLIHEINNRLAAVKMESDLRQLGQPPAPPSP